MSSFVLARMAFVKRLEGSNRRDAELAPDGGERDVAQPEGYDLLLTLRGGELRAGAVGVSTTPIW
jgi:hypothetical protein